MSWQGVAGPASLAAAGVLSALHLNRQSGNTEGSTAALPIEEDPLAPAARVNVVRVMSLVSVGAPTFFMLALFWCAAIFLLWRLVGAQRRYRRREKFAKTNTGAACQSWKVMQPDERRWPRLFIWPIIIILPFAGFIMWIFLIFCTGSMLSLLFVVIIMSVLVLGWPYCMMVLWFKSWGFNPPSSVGWMTNMYEKCLYILFQFLFFTHRVIDPRVDVPIANIKPRRILNKYQIDYALDIKVPMANQEEFSSSHGLLGSLVSWTFAGWGPSGFFGGMVENNLFRLPFSDVPGEFDPDENPVEFVMNQLGNIYPAVYQEWEDKFSDDALTRFVLYGLGAHRIETTIMEGQRMYVVRTNALSHIPMRSDYEPYGGDAYFDMNWKPVMIIDEGAGILPADGREVTFKPNQQTDEGKAAWNRAKFRFRSSLSVLVTAVDHLFGSHLCYANFMVTALREELDPKHPLRRLLIPFTYNTIFVNDNAYSSLIKRKTMAMRCFGFSDKGMEMVYASAPSLMMQGWEVRPKDGGPLCMNQVKYIKHLKDHGIDTEFTRQSGQFYGIMHEYISDVLRYYYQTPADMMADEQLLNFISTYLKLMTSVRPPFGKVHAAYVGSDVDLPTVIKSGDEQRVWDIVSHTVTTFCTVVTNFHEQVGAIEVYVQDASFCAFKWTRGKTVGTRQTATATALLMAFTSTPMPQLLNSDWTHLFEDILKPAGSGKPGVPNPIEAFTKWQEKLNRFSDQCKTYNAEASTRPFPECFPLYVCDPKVLETSISV